MNSEYPTIYYAIDDQTETDCSVTTICVARFAFDLRDRDRRRESEPARIDTDREARSAETFHQRSSSGKGLSEQRR